MPYADHLRLTCSGAFMAVGAPERERFSFRVNLSDPPATSDSFDQGRADDYAADCVAFFGSVGAGIASTAVLDEVKLAQIGSLGTYRGDPIVILVSQRGGGGGQIVHPTQVATAVSLQTARRGATGKGRLYLPLPVFGIDGASFTISAAQADGVRDAVSTWITALNDVPGLDGSAPRVTIASSKGYNSDVTGVRVGRVLETIRSRRTSLQEAYSLPSTIT